jgi:hypothetical protein
LPEASLLIVALNDRDCDVAMLMEDGDIETEMGLGEGEGGLLMVPPPHPAIAMDKAKSVAAVASLRIAPPDLHDLFFYDPREAQRGG